MTLRGGGGGGSEGVTLIFYLKHTLTFVIILQPSDVNFNHPQRMVVCAGSLTITFDPTSGHRSYSNLENFYEVFWRTKLQGKG